MVGPVYAIARLCRQRCAGYLLKAACDWALSAESRLRRFRLTRERRDFRAFSPLAKGVTFTR